MVRVRVRLRLGWRRVARAAPFERSAGVSHGLAHRVDQVPEDSFGTLLYVFVLEGVGHRSTEPLRSRREVVPGGLHLARRLVVRSGVEVRPQAVAQIDETRRHLPPGLRSRGGIGLGFTSSIVHVLLHLLDATYELFRAYFGFPNRLAPDGTEVGAIYGIIETTLRLLRQDDVTHLAAATDTVIESFRNDMFDGYKTGAGIEPALMAQFPLAEEALRILGVVVWPLFDFEADDGIATAALRWVDDVDKVVILSPDKDLMQCVVGDRIVSYNRREEKELNEAAVIEKFGVPPVSIPDYLALVGDTADGVPGIAGWGAKSTSTVLARYGRLERIPASPDEWGVNVRGAARLSANLEAARDDALLYRALTTLRRDVPLEESLDDLRWGGVHQEEYLALCDRFGFEEIRERPHVWAE